MSFAKHRPRREDNAARAGKVENVLRVGVVLALVGSVAWIVTAEFSNPLQDEPQAPAESVKPESSSAPREEPVEEVADETALVEIVTQAFKSGDWERVLSVAGKAQTSDLSTNDRAELNNICGVAEVRRGNHPEVVAWILKAIALNDKNPTYHLNWAEALRQQGHPQAALPPMKRTLQLSPDSFALKVKWTLLLVEAGETEAVAKQIEAIVTEDGGIPAEWGFAKAALLKADHKESEAAALLEELKTKIPQDIFETFVSDPALAAR